LNGAAGNDQRDTRERDQDPPETRYRRSRLH
jgi:hypothetical protein